MNVEFLVCGLRCELPIFEVYHIGVNRINISCRLGRFCLKSKPKNRLILNRKTGFSPLIFTSTE